MTIHLAMIVVSLAAFASLALAMERHQENLFRAALPAGQSRALRIAGWVLLMAALVLIVRARGWSLGLVAYSGYTSFAAGAVFLTLVAAERWRLRRQQRAR